MNSLEELEQLRGKTTVQADAAVQSRGLSAKGVGYR